MAPPSRFSWSSLTTIFLLFLSLLNIATASPLPDDHVNKILSARDLTSITEKRYEAYLKKYFPKTDHYLFYSGGAESQVKAFKAKKPGYYYYDDLFNAYDTDHPWYKSFNEETDEDNDKASSIALASTASGQVLVFGAIEYKTAGSMSFFTLQKSENSRMDSGTAESSPSITWPRVLLVHRKSWPRKTPTESSLGKRATRKAIKTLLAPTVNARNELLQDVICQSPTPRQGAALKESVPSHPTALAR
jgi:hypothetical protein